MAQRCMNKLKDLLRPFRDIVFTLYGYMYDCYRYIRFSGYRDYIKDQEKRNYKAVKIYHRLEKSLSFRERNPNSGIRSANQLESLLTKGAVSGSLGFQEHVGASVLEHFYGHASDQAKAKRITTADFKDAECVSDLGGVIFKSEEELASGKLEDPEAFFLSRSSVRDFSSQPVDHHEIVRALTLAMKTPSVCNRQGWYVYHIDQRELIDSCLSLQNGNRGFGHEIPCLLIIAADLKAFDTAGERYQYWIDGGMFSMSIIYALHALGLSTCCLNWSKTPKDDIRLRKLMPIKSNHSVLMMLAVGYPNEKIKVCYSARNPLDSIYEYWSEL